MRVRYRERETEYDDGPTPEYLPPTPEQTAQRSLRRWGYRALSVWSALVVVLGCTWIVLITLLREGTCIALALLGLVGRWCDRAGRAAAPHSRVLSVGHAAVARLAPPRVERVQTTDPMHLIGASNPVMDR